MGHPPVLRACYLIMVAWGLGPGAWGLKYQVSSIRYQVSGIKYQVSSIKYQKRGRRHEAKPPKFRRAACSPLRRVEPPSAHAHSVALV